MQKVNKGYHKLLVYQRARLFVRLIYESSESFPRSEEFGLKSQLRRSAVSIVLNLVEGNRRGSTKEYVHFLNIAEGSLSEVEACLELCLDLSLISQSAYMDLENKRGEIAFLLYKLKQSLRNKL